MKLMEKFIGQYVDVLVDVNISSRHESEEGLSEKSKPFVVSGWFIDFDKENIYIGTEENSISDYFNRDYVVHVGVSKPVDEFDDMLDGVETPSNENFN